MAPLSVNKSKALFEKAKGVIPGGVNSPVRAFKSVGGSPLFISHGKGAHLFDVDGNKFVDFVGSWGPLIFGHSADFVNNALSEALSKGSSFGAPTEREFILAELISKLIPEVELVRFVNSGTEATMSALRLARGATGRDYVIKFNGCYHGHADSFLVEAGSGVATLGISGSPGVPQDVARLTISVEFNDLDLLERVVEELGGDKLAAIIVEPLPANMGLIKPGVGYLQGIRELCDRVGAVLIFDEVLSGFRVGEGSASSKFSVSPDLFTFGKVIGGGLPVGAIGGRRELMELLAPVGAVYQAGTLSGNPLAMSAGIAVLERFLEQNPLPELSQLSKRFCEGLMEISRELGLSIQADSCGSLFGIFFSDKLPSNFAEVKQGNTKLYKTFFWGMLERGYYFAPSPYEVGFISTAHSKEMIDSALSAAKEVLLAP